MLLCRSIGCNNPTTDPDHDFCPECRQVICSESDETLAYCDNAIVTTTLVDKKPHHFRSVEHLDEVDVYAVHHLFEINDPSGAIQEASRKLLLSGLQGTGKPDFQNILEARDILTRWLELNTTLH